MAGSCVCLTGYAGPQCRQILEDSHPGCASFVAGQAGGLIAECPDASYWSLAGRPIMMKNVNGGASNVCLRLNGGTSWHYSSMIRTGGDIEGSHNYCHYNDGMNCLTSSSWVCNVPNTVCNHGLVCSSQAADVGIQESENSYCTNTLQAYSGVGLNSNKWEGRRMTVVNCTDSTDIAEFDAGRVQMGCP